MSIYKNNNEQIARLGDMVQLFAQLFMTHSSLAGLIGLALDFSFFCLLIYARLTRVIKVCLSARFGSDIGPPVLVDALDNVPPFTPGLGAH